MNPVKEIFEFISDDELHTAILEIQESEKDGIIKQDGLVRKYAKLVRHALDDVPPLDFHGTTVNLLKVAAYRYANFYTDLKLFKDGMEDMPPEFGDIVDKNFWDLI